MFILFPVIAAVVLVFFGYAALWSTYQSNLPKGVSQFGRIMSIILFVIAGLVLVLSATMRPGFGHDMPGKMHCGAFMQERCQMGQRDKVGMREMNKMSFPSLEREQPNIPAPQEGNNKK